MTRALRATSDLESIVSSVQNMSTDYSYIARQSAINNNNIDKIVDKFTTSNEVQEALKVLIDENFQNLTNQIIALNKEVDALRAKIG